MATPHLVCALWPILLGSCSASDAGRCNAGACLDALPAEDLAPTLAAEDLSQSAPEDAAAPDLHRPLEWVMKRGVAGEDLLTVWGSSPTDVYVGGTKLDLEQKSVAVLLHTTDRGRTWKSLDAALSPGASVIYSLGGTGANDVFASDNDGVIYRTVNRGLTWKATDLARDQGITPPYCCLQMIAGADGSMLGVGNYETVIATTDHGAHWKAVMGPNPNRNRGWTGVAASNGIQPTIWVIGDFVVPVSRDRGQHWTFAPDNPLWLLGHGWARSDYEVFAVGSYDGPGSPSLLVHSRDGGQTWTREVLPPVSTSAIWGSGDDLWVVGARHILHSPDVGASWSIQYTNDSDQLSNGWSSNLWGFGPDDVWVVGAGKVLHLE